jgi:hypothetical protein
MSNICKCRNSGNNLATKVISEPNMLSSIGEFLNTCHITAPVSPYFLLEFCNFATAAPPVLRIFSMPENNMKHKIVIEIPPYWPHALE